MKNPEQTLRTDTWTAEGVFRAIVLLILWPRTTIVLSGVSVGVRSYFLPTFPALGENAALDMVAARTRPGSTPWRSGGNWPPQRRQWCAEPSAHGGKKMRP